LAIAPEPANSGGRRLADRPLRQRYRVADVDVLTAQEARRFITAGRRDPGADISLA
jgi:hypothetical protein